MGEQIKFVPVFTYIHTSDVAILLNRLPDHFDVIEIYYFDGTNMTFSGCEIKYALDEAEAASGYEIDDIKKLVAKNRN